VIKELESDYGKENTIVINAGNSFCKTNSADGVIKDKALLTFGAFEKMGIDIYGVGVFDLIFGVGFLNEQATGKTMQFLCANLLKKKDDQPNFKPYVLLNRNGKKILVTQAIDPNSELPDKDFYCDDVVKRLAGIRDSVPHDYLIVVLYASEEDAQAYLKQLTGVNIAILGSQRGQADKKKYVGETLVLYNNYLGRSLAFVDITFPSKNVKNLTDEVKTDGPHYEVVSMENVKEDPEIEKMITDYKLKNGLYKLKNPDETVQYAENYNYVGKDWCVKCHQEIVDSWSKTKHAHAMDTLIEKGKQDDPNCFSCHVTAVMGAGGGNTGQWAGEFVNMAFTPHMANVQCESCHGMADGHVNNPKAWFVQNITPETCKRCHTPERDPGFDNKQDWKKGIHIIKQGEKK